MANHAHAKKSKVRNRVIRQAYAREINLCTKIERDKSKFSRNVKHKKAYQDDTSFLFLAA